MTPLVNTLKELARCLRFRGDQADARVVDAAVEELERVPGLQLDLGGSVSMETRDRVYRDVRRMMDAEWNRAIEAVLKVCDTVEDDMHGGDEAGGVWLAAREIKKLKRNEKEESEDGK